jgi:sulfonate transport system substrate-binding protein
MSASWHRRQILHGAGAMLALAGCRRAPASTAGLGISTTAEGYQNFFAAAGQDKTPYPVNYAILPFDLSLQSINAGTLDLGFNFSDIPTGIWGAEMRQLRIIALIAYDGPSHYLGLVARPGIKADSIADLRGKRIGYLRTSNYHYYLLRLLERSGMTISDIDAVSLNRDTLPTAFSSGHIDAWVTQAHETAIAQRRYGGHLIDWDSDAYAGNTVVVANARSLDDDVKREAIGDYLLRLRHVLAWIASHRETWAASFAARTGVDARDLLDWRAHQREQPHLQPVSDLAIAQQKAALALFTKAGVVPHAVDPTPLWDARFTPLLTGHASQ